MPEAARADSPQVIDPIRCCNSLKLEGFRAPLLKPSLWPAIMCFPTGLSVPFSRRSGAILGKGNREQNLGMPTPSGPNLTSRDAPSFSIDLPNRESTGASVTHRIMDVWIDQPRFQAAIPLCPYGGHPTSRKGAKVRQRARPPIPLQRVQFVEIV